MSVKQVTILVLSFLLSCSSPPSIEEVSPEDLRRSVIGIRVTRVDILDGRVIHGYVSGVIIGEREDRFYAVSVQHMIISNDSDLFRIPVSSVVYNDREEDNVPFRIEKLHPTADLALISFPRTDFSARPTKISLRRPKILTKVNTIGYPADTNRLVTPAYIAGICEEAASCEIMGTKLEGYVLDRATARGASGGGVFTKDGKLIGIMAANITAPMIVFSLEARKGAWTTFISIREIAYLDSTFKE